jgi:DNA-binding response OmpR family regulator
MRSQGKSVESARGPCRLHPDARIDVATILVVDDEAPIRANLRRFLQLQGHAVIEAADGGRGLEAARASAPALILCDIAMPGMDGYAVLAAVKADAALATTPFVFVSAAAEAAERTRGLEAGADAYVTKPFELAELAALISRLIG